MANNALKAWQDLALGAAICQPGNAAELKTGDWRSMTPQIDESKCIKCAICLHFCPESCVDENSEGFYHPDLYYCKGCGICANECPKKAITMTVEER